MIPRIQLAVIDCALPSWGRGLACAVAMLASLATIPVQAGKVVWVANGFESPTYAVGAVNNQQGWVSTVPISSPSTAMVQAAIGKGGEQGLRVTKGANADARWTRFPTGTPFTPSRYVTLDWDFFRTDRPATAGTPPVFGLETYANMAGGFAVTAGLFVDSTTGEVLAQTAASGGQLATINRTVPINTWRHFRVQLDYQTDTYNAYLDGTLVLANAGFVDGPQTVFSDADLAALAGNFDFNSNNATGFATFDNVIVRDGLPTDFNHNNIVDAADYTLWRDSLGQIGWGLPADANGDGVVNTLDWNEWRTDFGRTNGALITSLVGDYNLNGSVDAADYSVARDNFGQLGYMLPADGNGSGMVDPGDITVWQQRYGSTASASIAASAVPEPAALLLLLLAAPWICCRVGS